MKLAETTGKYIGKPFAKCGCIELVVDIMRDIGRPLPEEIDGVNLENYRALTGGEVKTANRLMLKCFSKIGAPVRSNYPAIADLLVVAQRSGRMFPAVCVGPGMAIASFIRSGVAVFKMDKYNHPVMIRRVD